MLRAFLFLLLFCNVCFAQKIDIIKDLPNQKVENAILFLGDPSIIKTQQGLIESFHDVKFLVMVSSLLNPQDIKRSYPYSNVQLKFLDFPITSWAQDRMLRMQGKITGVNSEHMSESMSIYETVAVYEASQILELKSDTYSNLFSVSKYTGKDPFVTRKLNNQYFTARDSNLFFGDGGDRLVTEKFIFMGGNSLVNIQKLKTDQKIEELTSKKIIGLDTSAFSRYTFHLDMFLTPVSEHVFMMGSYKKALELLPDNLSWLDYELMKRQSLKEDAIIKTLNDLGIEVKIIPLLYKKDEGVISFNNGLFNGNKFYLSNYKMTDNINVWLDKIKQDVEQSYHEEGIDLIYIEGGENNIALGGQIRCTMAIVKTTTLKP